MFWLLDVTRR